MKTLNQISYARQIPVVTLRYRMRRLGITPKVIDGAEHLTTQQERLVVQHMKLGRPRKNSK